MLSGAFFGSEVTHMYEDLEHPQNIGHLFGVLPIGTFEPLERYFERIAKAAGDVEGVRRARTASPSTCLASARRCSRSGAGATASPSVRRPGASWCAGRAGGVAPPAAPRRRMTPYAPTVEHVAGVDVRITRGDGKPLLLLTRMASGGMGIWDAIWDDLARHYTVANFDLVGAAAACPRTSPPRERFGRLADRTADVAPALGFDDVPRLRLVRRHARRARLHAARTRRVRSRILLDPFFELPDPRKLEKAIAFKRRLFESDDRSLYAYYWVMAGFSPVSSSAIRRGRAACPTRGSRPTDSSRSTPSAGCDGYGRCAPTGLSDDELAAMNVPTLVLATSLDSWHAGPTVGMARALVERLPDAALK